MQPRILYVVFWLAIACPATACLCGTPPLKYAFRHSDVLFVGTVVRSVEADAWIRPTMWLKGQKPQLTTTDHLVHVRTVGWGTSCEMSLLQGRVYLVDADDDDGRLRVSFCSRTSWDERAARDARIIRHRSWWWRTPFGAINRYAFWQWVDRRTHE